MIDQKALMVIETMRLHLIPKYYKADVEFEPVHGEKLALIDVVQKLMASFDACEEEAEQIWARVVVSSYAAPRADFWRSCAIWEGNRL